METIKAQRISPIPYISHDYGGLLAHERRKAQGEHHKINMVHLSFIVIIHNKNEDQTKFKSKYEYSSQTLISSSRVMPIGK
jgi:hypothetical protein